MTMEERKAKGLLWTDTPEAMGSQAYSLRTGL